MLDLNPTEVLQAIREAEVNGITWPSTQEEKDQVIKILQKSPLMAYRYCRHFSKQPEPQLEKTIALNPLCSRLYAKNVLKGRFKLGEKIIKSIPVQAFRYAKETIKGRWKPGEAAIATDAKLAYHYATRISKRPLPAAEKAICDTDDSVMMIQYARLAVKGRVPMFEPKLVKYVEDAFDYARNVIHGRFHAGEEIIGEHKSFGYFYAKHILKARFPAVEKTFLELSQNVQSTAEEMDLPITEIPESNNLYLKRYCEEFPKFKPIALAHLKRFQHDNPNEIIIDVDLILEQIAKREKAKELREAEAKKQEASSSTDRKFVLEDRSDDIESDVNSDLEQLSK
jgi:hypothetical protein